MLQILFAVLLSLATACDEDNGGGNEDPKPSKFSVTLSVKDVSASTASVETTPNDNTVHYFCDAVTKAEYDKAGEDAFIAGLLESYEVQLEEERPSHNSGRRNPNAARVVDTERTHAPDRILHVRVRRGYQLG